MRVTPEYVSDGANAPRRRDGKNSDSTDTDFDRAVAQELQRRQDLLADAVDHLGPLIAVLRKLKEGGMEVSMRLDPPPTMDDRRISGEMTVPRFHAGSADDPDLRTYTLCMEGTRAVLCIGYTGRTPRDPERGRNDENFQEWEYEIACQDRGRVTRLSDLILDAAFRLRTKEEQREVSSFQL